MLAAIRRLRVLLWRAALTARLRRQGVRLVFSAGPNLRLAGRPRTELDPYGAARGGTLVVNVGRDVRIGRELVLDVRAGGEHVLELGDGAVLQDRVRLQLRGGAIRLAEHAQLRDGCELKSAGELRVGRRVVCGRGSTLHCAAAVSLGDRSGLGDRVFVTDSDHGNDGSDTWFLELPLRVGPVEVGENVLLGTGCLLLRGSRVGANAVVAAGALVNGTEVEAGWLVAGQPARPIRALGLESSGP